MHSSQDDSDIVAGRQFNARSIFLQDGLELSYASGDALSVDISLSNYGEGALPAATQLTWSVLLEGKAIKTATAAYEKATAALQAKVASENDAEQKLRETERTVPPELTILQDLQPS